MTVSHCTSYMYIAGNLWGTKPSRISQFASHPQKFSPWILGICHTHLHVYNWFSFMRKFQNAHFYWSTEVFSLESFPLIMYMYYLLVIWGWAICVTCRTKRREICPAKSRTSGKRVSSSWTLNLEQFWQKRGMMRCSWRSFSTGCSMRAYSL